MTASIDDTITVWIATHRWPPIDWLFIGLGWIEKLGAVWIVLAIGVSLASNLGWKRSILFGAYVGVVTFVADSVTFGIKDLVARARPFVTHPQIHPLYVVHSSSFPAGHAATAFAGATLLSWLARRWTPAFVALACAIGFSRVYVGDHYVGDVIGGAFVGGVVGLAALLVMQIFGVGRRLAAAAGTGSQP